MYNNETFLYEWLGGDDAGSGPPSDYPYSHFVYNFQDLKRTYPSWACTAALQSTTYDRHAAQLEHQGRLLTAAAHALNT